MSRDLKVEVRMSNGKKVSVVRAAWFSWSIQETWN